MKKKPHIEEKYTYIYIKASIFPIGEKSVWGTKICAIR